MRAITYFDIGETQAAGAWLERARQKAPDATFVKAAEAYGKLLGGDIGAAREISLDVLENPSQFLRWWGGYIAARYAVDALIDRGESMHAVELLLKAEPRWDRLRHQSHREIQGDSAVPAWLGTGTGSVEFFPDLARALRAAGNETGAENILSHMQANLEFQRDAGFVVFEILTAELYALLDRENDALDALEQAEMDKTIYRGWQFNLVHSRIFDDIRDHPRFVALLERIRAEMDRQRTELRNKRRSNNQIPL
jgi:hypothetical protein